MTTQRKAFHALSIAVFLTLLLSACSQDVQRGRVPSEVQEVVARIGEQISQEQYDQIYNESSERWKQEITLDKSNEVFKTLREKLGKVESRSLTYANEQENSGGPLKGHVFILSYRTRFERGDAGETFTLVDENGSWLLARYLVNSTALNK
jgi:outer membrane lipoprotein-sorting protein